MSEEKLKLKEMCEAFEVTPRTLRYYEYIELLIPEKIGKKRLYGNKEKALLTLIKRGRRFGFSLEEIRQWLAMYNRDNQNQTQIEAWINMANNQTIELEERKSEIQKAIDDIKNLRVDAERELRALLKK